MEHTSGIIHETLPEETGTKAEAADDRVRDLKELLSLLLKEVEYFEKTPHFVNKRTIPERINLAEEVQRFETELIRYALIRTNGRQRRAARLLGTKISTLNAKIKRYKIDTYAIFKEI